MTPETTLAPSTLDAAIIVKENPVTGTTTNAAGVTTHRCTACGKRFDGTQKRGRPHKRCPDCRSKK